MPKIVATSKDKPYVSNYPPLRDWLDERNARCSYQLPIGDKKDPLAYLELYLINGVEVVVLVYGHGNGWNLFTPSATGKIDETFVDADARIAAARGG